jgi:sugar phosphate permease
MSSPTNLDVATECSRRPPLGRHLASEMIAAYLRPILLVFLPFAAGYFLSYFFRTINAVIAGQLTAELGLDASHLGLMTSVYFLTFAAIQLPLGVLLDRFGPRRVQSGLLLVAAIGAALFARSNQFAALVVGRALIGFGVAGALIAGLKAIVSWFPKERILLFNGCFIMLGTLGAICATSPAAWLLAYIGWRGLLDVMAGVTAATALIIFFVVPDRPSHIANAPSSTSGGLRDIFGDRRFWRLAPLSTMCISTAWAVQGLWAGPWLADVDGLPRESVVLHLLVMAVTLSAAALLLGIGADRLRSRGIPTQAILGCAGLVFVAAESLLILDVRSVSYASWAVVAGMGAGTVLSYSILAQYFPKEIAGRANAALNVFHIGGAFVLQEVIGWIINQWPTHGGHYPAIAYKAALALMIVLQIVALIWFVHLDQKLQAFVSKVIRRSEGWVSNHGTIAVSRSTSMGEE